MNNRIEITTYSTLIHNTLQNNYFIIKNNVKNAQNSGAAFGMLMPGRSFSSSAYKFGFNGKEKDDEWTGSTGSHLDFGARIYDSRIGRWMSVDPLTSKYPYWTPYQFAGNMPIQYNELEGKEPNNQWGLMLLGSYEHAGMSPQESSEMLQKTGKIALITYKTVAIIATSIIQPEVGIPWAVADLTGVPVTPAPQAWSTPVISSSIYTKATTTDIAAYDVEFAIKQGLNSSEGTYDFNAIKSMIPKETPNSFKPSENISTGEKYIFKINDTKVNLKWHSPDAKAPLGSNSATTNTAQIKIDNKLFNSEGLFQIKPDNSTHIPLKRN